MSKQLQTLQKEQEPPFLLKKNEFLLERKEIEFRLTKAVEEEKAIEAEEKSLTEMEKSAVAPSDKQNL